MRGIKTLVNRLMENYQVICLIVLSFIWMLLGVAGSYLAKKRNRSQVLWFVNCAICGIFGLLVIACSSTLENDEDLNSKTTDTLGLIIFFASIALFGFILGFSMKV